MRYLIIANPTAGRRRAARLADAVHGRLIEAGATSRIEHTTAPGAAESIAESALASSAPDDPLCVVACGGDGTVQEVVNAMMRCPEAGGVLGLAAGGRCNDFASAFGVDSDPDRIAATLLSCRRRRADIGRVDDRYFCTIAALGFDAAVSRYVNDMRMPLRGTISYVYGVLCVLWSYRANEVRLVFDDETRDGPLFMAACANTSSYGGSMCVAPDARPDDGLLDVCVVNAIPRLRVLRLLRRVMLGRHTDLPEVRFVRTASVRVETALRQEIWADGECVGNTPATISIIADAIEILVPRE